MSKRLVSRRSPYLRLDLSVSLGKRKFTQSQVEVLFDSGFSGDVAIPAALIGNSKAPPALAYSDVILANGSVISSAVYEGTVFFPEFTPEQSLLPVDVVVMGNEVLVGRRLMDHFRVTLDHGKQLIVEP